MNHIIVVTVLVVALVAMTVQIIRALRSDGYGLRPPPRSHREEVDDARPFGTLV